METHTNMIWPVHAPCLIAYRDTLAGYFWLRPYVDISLKNKIWGIAINGQVFHLTHEEEGNWEQAQKLQDVRSKAKMPSTTVIDIASRYRREFDATVQMLKTLQINAEPWRNDWYWTSEEDGVNATVMNMVNGCIELVPKTSKGCTRLVSHYVIKKPIILGCSLAYLNNNRLEIAPDLRLELKDRLWGVHVAKNYTCMRLTYEPNKMTVNAGMDLSKSLSTDILQVDLPTSDDVDSIGDARDSINDTLVKLSAYGVKVNLIYEKELSWLTRSFWSQKGFVTYGNLFVPKEKACLCRLFGRNKDEAVII